MSSVSSSSSLPLLSSLDSLSSLTAQISAPKKSSTITLGKEDILIKFSEDICKIFDQAVLQKLSFR